MASSGIMLVSHLEMLRWISGRLSMVQVVVGAVIHHVPEQATGEERRSRGWAREECHNIPELKNRKKRKQNRFD